MKKINLVNISSFIGESNVVESKVNGNLVQFGWNPVSSSVNEFSISLVIPPSFSSSSGGFQDRHPCPLLATCRGQNHLALL